MDHSAILDAESIISASASQKARLVTGFQYVVRGLMHLYLSDYMHVSSGATKGFILLWSHMQKHSSRPVNTLKHVRLVELPFKCADISSQIRDTVLQFGLTNLPFSLHITTSTFVTDCGLFDLK